LAYDGGVKIILAPIDFSGASAHVIEAAGALAGAADAYVVLLHVVRADVADVVPDLGALADEKLAEYKRWLRQRSIATIAVRMYGNPATDIVVQAKKMRADYIVMGSRGHTPWHTLIVGNTTGTVMKLAPCPVMIVPIMRTPAASAPRMAVGASS
jgi:nucleotide-binding universal stress UspA family protein